jgi:hypothetical protein
LGFLERIGRGKEKTQQLMELGLSVVQRPLIYRSKGKSEPAEGMGNVMAFCLMKK